MKIAADCRTLFYGMQPTPRTSDTTHKISIGYNYSLGLEVIKNSYLGPKSGPKNLSPCCWRLLWWRKSSVQSLPPTFKVLKWIVPNWDLYGHRRVLLDPTVINYLSKMAPAFQTITYRVSFQANIGQDKPDSGGFFLLALSCMHSDFREACYWPCLNGAGHTNQSIPLQMKSSNLTLNTY